MQMTLAAEFYAGTRSKAPVLDIVRIGNGNREQVETIHVINKREARTIAKAMGATPWRSEEHTSELQSLMRISYAVFCLQKKNTSTYRHVSTTCHTHKFATYTA